MSCCLTAVSHYLKYCLVIKGVLCHSPRTQDVLMNLTCNKCLEITLPRLLPHLPGANEFILYFLQMREPFYWQGLTSTPVWINNHIPSKMWDEISYPFPKFQWLHHQNLGMDKKFHPILYNGCNYISMLGLKLIHVSKRLPVRSYKRFCHSEF